MSEKTIGDVIRAATSASGESAGTGQVNNFNDMLKRAAESAAPAEQRMDTVRRLLQVIDAGGGDAFRDVQADYLLGVIDRLNDPIFNKDLSPADVQVLTNLRDKLVGIRINATRAADLMNGSTQTEAGTAQDGQADSDEVAV